MIETVYIREKLIAIKGVGKLFYQDGFPIAMAVTNLASKGIEVSILHVADECMKNGWSGKTTFNKLKVDFAESAETRSLDLNVLEKFCFSTYEEQREMIFQYLFNESSEETKQNLSTSPAVDFFVEYIKQTHTRS